MPTPTNETEMPQIPIPVPLPTPLRIRQRQEIDDLDSTFGNMMIDDSKRNVHFGDKDNYFLHTPYNQEIIKNLQAEEMKYVLSPNFLSARVINHEHRICMVDFLIKARHNLNLQYSTLHLSVRLMDRFVKLQPVTVSKYQLLALTCLFIAAKIEEINPPKIAQLIDLAGKKFSEFHFLGTEVIVLVELKFKIHMPTAMDFLDQFLLCVPNSELMEAKGERVKTMCKYVLDKSLMDIQCVQWSASTIAAAAVMVAVDAVGKSCTKNKKRTDDGNRKKDFTIPDELLQHYTNHTKEHLIPCVQRLCNVLRNGHRR